MRLIVALIFSVLLSSPVHAQSSTWTTSTWTQSLSSLKSAPSDTVLQLPTKGYVALLTTTTLSSLLGDLTGKTLTATITLNVNGPVSYGLEGTPNNACVHPPNARLWFSSSAAKYSPSATPATAFWWSNPAEVQLTANDTYTLSVPFSTGNWSDSQGEADTTLSSAFAATVSTVRQIGLSFGGGCFFDVGVAGSGTLALTAITAS